MKKVTIFLLLIVIGLTQTDVEEMMKKIEQATQKEMEETQKKVDQYISAQDSAFAAFLEQEWELFNTDPGKEVLEKPKPKDIPVAKPEPEIELSKEKVKDIPIPEKKKEEEIRPEPQPAPEPKPIQEEKKPKEKQPYEQTLKMDFYGTPLEINYSKEFKTNLESPFDNKNISASWKHLAATKYEDFLKQLQNYQSRLNMNGWGYYKLVEQVGKKINNGSQSDATVFTWFFLTKSGYKVRVAYNDNNVYILMPSSSMLYSTSYLTIDGDKYFLINRERNKKDKIYSYRRDYPEADKVLDLKLATEPELTSQTRQKKLKFDYMGQSHTIKVEYKPAVIDFLTDYPQTDYDIYFSAPMNNDGRVTLVKSLAPLLEGKSTTEAVNLLLRFVQTSFQYKTDDLNFGREKPLFPDETLFYPFSDCEDRSILFAYLTKELLGLDVIGIKYPGHVATAINIKGPVKGDYLSYNGENYIICDPTYINANAGQSMPEYKNVKPEIVFQ
ncbi:MAG: procyclic acidic repetitive family protein [Candidatus Marinimicrobia bacterium]|nr:procyclic acidic repetitive family protein [Candidatus Neomarinimicrobiota bacterium]